MTIKTSDDFLKTKHRTWY